LGALPTAGPAAGGTVFGTDSVGGAGTVLAGADMVGAGELETGAEVLFKVQALGLAIFAAHVPGIIRWLPSADTTVVSTVASCSMISRNEDFDPPEPLEPPLLVQLAALIAACC
jgi:hypothetical protein